MLIFITHLNKLNSSLQHVHTQLILECFAGLPDTVQQFTPLFSYVDWHLPL